MKKIWLGSIFLIVIIGSVYIFLGGFGDVKKNNSEGNAGEYSKDRFFTVKKGDFNVSLNLDGNLDAIKRHAIKVKIQSGMELEIGSIVEDRTELKKGDTIVEISTAKFIDKEKELIQSIADKDKEIRDALEELKMTKSKNLSLIKGAVDQLRNTKENLQKYEEQDAPIRKKSLNKSIDDAKEAFNNAEKGLSQAKAKVSDARMEDSSKLESLESRVRTAEKSLESQQVSLDKSYYNLRNFKQYEHPRKMRSLQDALTKQKMNYEDTFVSVAGKELRVKRKMSMSKSRKDNYQEKLDMLREDMKNLRVISPVDGIISIGTRSRWGKTNKDLAVGSNIYSNQVIATIPDLSKFMVKVNIPEEFRSRVKKGLLARLTCKAIPDLALNGSITEIATMASNLMEWDSSSPKVYKTKLNTDSADKRLMPGMTIKVEIIVDKVENVFFCPIESIYNREGKKFCKIRSAIGLKEVEVEVGRLSYNYVEIISGLKLDDQVFLHSGSDSVMK